VPSLAKVKESKFCVRETVKFPSIVSDPLPSTMIGFAVALPALSLILTTKPDPTVAAFGKVSVMSPAVASARVVLLASVPVVPIDDTFRTRAETPVDTVATLRHVSTPSDIQELEPRDVDIPPNDEPSIVSPPVGAIKIDRLEAEPILSVTVSVFPGAEEAAGRVTVT